MLRSLKLDADVPNIEEHIKYQVSMSKTTISSYLSLPLLVSGKEQVVSEQSLPHKLQTWSLRNEQEEHISPCRSWKLNNSCYTHTIISNNKSIHSAINLLEFDTCCAVQNWPKGLGFHAVLVKEMSTDSYGERQ